MTRREELYNQLAKSITNFEVGDILSLSEIIDLLEELLSITEENSFHHNKYEKMLNLTNEEIKGNSSEDIVDSLTTMLEEEQEIISLDLPLNFELNSETIKVFILEGEERIILAQETILELEDDMENKKIIDEIFRVFHTIKGECGFLGLTKLGEITHNLETLLDMLRYNEIENSVDLIDIILEGIDIISALFKALKEQSAVRYNEINISTLVYKIETITTGVRVPIGQVLVEEGLLSNDDIKDIKREQVESGYTKKFGEIATAEGKIKESDIKNTLKKQRDKQKEGEAFIKVSVNQVNYLVDMIGELIIAENQIDAENMEYLFKVTKEIQQTAMMLRTIKIKNLFINMKRVIRDAANKLGKKVRLVLEGEDLEVDRKLVEHLEEPLIHILRNSVGHGIELPEIREDLGKDPTGEILLKAQRVGNHIKITIRDDGAGINRDKIISKAIEKDLILADKVDDLEEEDIYKMIFNPGFSTSESVDKVSGRGVGMDIVKSKINELRGNISIESIQGSYTTFELEFPLIMAIIDSMIILVDGVHFILPIVNVIETLKFESKNVHNIESKESVINIRNEIIPVIRLRDSFKMNDTAVPTPELAIVIEHNKGKYALVVDQIVTKKEVVIKSLGDKLTDVWGISAATILNGGVIGYIMNIDEVVKGRVGSKLAIH